MTDMTFWSWDSLRVLTFFILFVCFVILVYRGVFKAIADPKNFYWDRFMNLLWCFSGCIVIASVLYDDIAGGWRVFVVFLVTCAQLYVVLFKNPYDRSNGDSRNV